MIISTAARNAMCDALVDLLDAGAGAATVKGYTATQPAGPDTAVSGQTLLCTITCDDPAFGASSSGTATAADFTPESSATAGTCTWMRWADSNGTAVFDTSVSTSGADINFNTNDFAGGDQVDITAFTVTVPAS